MVQSGGLQVQGLQCPWYNKVSRMPLTLQLVAWQKFPWLYIKQDFSHMSTSLRLNFVVDFQLLSHVWLFNPMDCSRPGFPVLHHFLELPRLIFIESVMPSTISSSAAPFYSCLQSFPASRSFLISWLFTSHGQSTETSVSALVLPINIQDSFPLGLMALISLLSKDSSPIPQHQFFSAQPSLWFNSYGI